MTRRRNPWLTALLGAGLILLAALVVRDGAVNWALENDPGAALALGPGDPRALAAAADDALAAVKTAGDLPRAESLARRALAQGPLQDDALRDLGLIAAARGDVTGAYRLLSVAGRRSPLDGPSHLWLMKYRLLTGDCAGAFKDADDLIRHRPELLPPLTPLLMAYGGPGARALTARLATDPPWRGAFLAAFAAEARDPALVFTLLSGLESGPAKPTSAELTAYFNRRVADHAYQRAYLDWLRLLPPKALARAGAPYDGDFVGLPGAAPFNWTFGAGLGGEAEIGPAPDGAPGSALHVTYDGYSTPDLASQLLALGPGAYRLSGSARSLGDGSGALAWTVTCADNPARLLASVTAPSAPQGWRSFSITFQTPADGCAGQWLRLTPLPAEPQRSIEVWFRGLSIVGA